MRASASRLFASTCRLCTAAQKTVKMPSCMAPKTLAAAQRLSPVRYHIFRNPVPYPIGLSLQQEIVNYRLARRNRDQTAGKTDIVLLLEHTPTYTTGRRDNSPSPNELHPEEKKVQNVGAEFHITKRGGQVTYHGPGQLVGYPIMDLNAMEMATRCYVDYLQNAIASFIREEWESEVLAPHPDGHVGIFASPTEKISSIGIHLTHRITSHGFALNVTQEPLKWFDLVLACGLADVKAISLHDLIVRNGQPASAANAIPPNVKGVAEGLIPRLEEIWGRKMIDLEEGESSEEVDELKRMCEQAEGDAERDNTERGGWPTEPDLSRRMG